MASQISNNKIILHPTDELRLILRTAERANPELGMNAGYDGGLKASAHVAAIYQNAVALAEREIPRPYTTKRTTPNPTLCAVMKERAQRNVRLIFSEVKRIEAVIQRNRLLAFQTLERLTAPTPVSAESSGARTAGESELLDREEGVKRRRMGDEDFSSEFTLPDTAAIDKADRESLDADLNLFNMPDDILKFGIPDYLDPNSISALAMVNKKIQPRAMFYRMMKKLQSDYTGNLVQLSKYITKYGLGVAHLDLRRNPHVVSSEQVKQLIAAVPKLQGLTLQGDPENIDNVGLGYLPGLKELKVLSLTCQGELDRELNFAPLSAMTSLEELDLSYTPFQDRDLQYVQPLHRLRKLGLPVFIRGQGFAHLKDLPLEVLRLDIEEEAYWEVLPNLSDLGELKKLNELQLHWVVDLREIRVVHALKKLTQIRVLSLIRFSGDERDLDYLKYLSRLEVFRVRYSSITDTPLPFIKGIKKLRFLDLDTCRQITDLGLTTFQDLPRLEGLSLQDCKEITDASIPLLLKCKKLKSIVIAGTQITPAGAALLQQNGINVVSVLSYIDENGVKIVLNRLD